jgi:predicted phosphodiesterase
MRLAIISDIHGNSAALEAVLADISKRDVESIANLGDCFSGPLDAAGTAKILAPLDLPTLRGNHDRQLIDRPIEKMGKWEGWCIEELALETLEWCRELPLIREVGGVLLCHATPSNDEENWLDRRGPEHRLVARDLKGVEERAAGVVHSMTVCGHTHAPRNVQLPDGRRIVNPGSVGCPCYLDDRVQPNFVQETGSPDARYAIIEQLGDDWRVNLVSVPYDAEGMARLAEAKGADNWAHALRTGWWS